MMGGTVYQEAIREFQKLFARMEKFGVQEPAAVILATADRSAAPSVRTVLLKEADERGFVFYTNLQSRKGRQLASNPQAALCFYWEPLGMQVIIEGKAAQVSDQEADAYWVTRPRQSQIGAWASAQSRPLKSRAILLIEAARLMKKFSGKPIPRPPHWSGFRVVPERIEFWKRRPFRLHERRLYSKQGGVWKRQILSP